jgi:uncharacterized membrane protein YebE (DUF533 family)
MDASGFLDQLLRSAQGMMSQTQERVRSTSERVETQGIGGIKLGKFAQGAIAGGALSLLLGSRSGRKLATWGGAAALGTMAWRAWQERQAQGGGSPAAQAVIEPRTIDRLPAPEVETHSRAILVALVGAAKADGHIDERERGLIHDEIGRLSNDTELQAFMDAELARPLDAATVAAAATSPELACEMYLASLLLADQQHADERAYLDTLAVELKIDPQLKASLERQVDGGANAATP